MYGLRRGPIPARYAWLATGILIGAVAGSCGATITNSTVPPGTLRVTELVVVDPAGVERVRIGGDLPDAVIGGAPVPRGEQAAGVLLYDATGQERGGYVTWEPSGNVGLTLDTRERQVALFVADPEAGVALRLWHGEDALELRSDEDGSRFTAVAGGRVVFQEPAVDAMGAEACAAYRGALADRPRAEVEAICGERFPAAACVACLENH